MRHTESRYPESRYPASHLAPCPGGRPLTALVILTTMIVSLHTLAGEPVMWEVHYDKNGNIDQSTDAAKPTRVVQPSNEYREIRAADVPATLMKHLGEATLMVFWSSGEPKSRGLLSRLQKMSEKWRSKGLSILTFSVDAKKSGYTRYAKRYKSSFETIWISNYLQGTLGIELRKVDILLKSLSFPMYAWFDKEGKLVQVKSGAPSLSRLSATAAKIMKVAPPEK